MNQLQLLLHDVIPKFYYFKGFPMQASMQASTSFQFQCKLQQVFKDTIKFHNSRLTWFKIKLLEFMSENVEFKRSKDVIEKVERIRYL